MSNLIWCKATCSNLNSDVCWIQVGEFKLKIGRNLCFVSTCKQHLTHIMAGKLANIFNYDHVITEVGKHFQLWSCDHRAISLFNVIQFPFGIFNCHLCIQVLWQIYGKSFNEYLTVWGLNVSETGKFSPNPYASMMGMLDACICAHDRCYLNMYMIYACIMHV